MRGAIGKGAALMESEEKKMGLRTSSPRFVTGYEEVLSKRAHKLPS